MNFSCSKYRGRNAELIRLINPVDYSLFIQGELVKQTQKWEETLLKLKAQCVRFRGGSKPGLETDTLVRSFSIT